MSDTSLSCLFNLPPRQFSLLSSIIGLMLTEGLDINQQNSLGNFLVNIGQNMTTAAAQQQLLEDLKGNNKNGF